MGLIESLTGGALGLRADVSGTPAAWDDYWYEPLGNSSASGMRISASSAKRIATVLSCVSLKASDVGMMPIKIYSEAPDGSKKVVNHHPLYDVLYSRPNEHQTAFEFKQMLQGHVELRGNGYAEIIPGARGAVDQLIPMHPDRVHVERLKPSGRLRYVYNDPLTNSTRNLVEEEVFHLRQFPDEMGMGQSTIAMASDTFGVGLAQQDYAARFLKNDARPPFAIEGWNPKTDEDRKKFLEGIQLGNTGENRGKAMLLRPGLTIKPVGVSPADQQLLDARKFSRIEICSIFHVPPHLIGETEKTATYASVEQFNIMYAVHCILPILIMWEQAIQRDLLTSDKYFPKFSMAALLRGDTASRYNAYHTALGDGWVCQDEVRALEDMNPTPNGVGKNFWRPVNWTLLSNTAAPVAPGEPDENADADDDDPNDGPDAGGTNPGGDDDSNADARTNPATVRMHLEALASSAADRCVRKEVAALRKMVERNADGYQIEEFYASHTGFVKEVLHLDAENLTRKTQGYFERAAQLCAFIASGDKAGAYETIDRIAATESLHLASMATGGKQ
jgi:HK97 family phage portal protein